MKHFLAWACLVLVAGSAFGQDKTYSTGILPFQLTDDQVAVLPCRPDMLICDLDRELVARENRELGDIRETLRQSMTDAVAEQYMAFVEEAKKLRIELAADYLVMAAWLAFLKSRLLLPADPDEEGPSGEELAAHLAFQLERLEAMRRSAARLMARDQLGRDFFARGIPERYAVKKKICCPLNRE